jgi:hypothetical protein
MAAERLRLNGRWMRQSSHKLLHLLLAGCMAQGAATAELSAINTAAKLT